MRWLFVLTLSALSVYAQPQTFMDRAKEQTKANVEKILSHPFLLDLAHGNLSGDIFNRFSVQDNIYSWRYADPLMLLAIKTSNYGEKLFFMKGAQDSTQEWGGALPASISQCPSCEAYSDFELSAAGVSMHLGLAAIAPCYVVYAQVAEWLLKNSVAGNPYQKWIQEYAAPGFQNSTRRIEEIINKYARSIAQDEQERMLVAYKKAVRYEWQFWNSIYDDTQWQPTHDQP